jgi:hypothetical protein
LIILIQARNLYVVIIRNDEVSSTMGRREEERMRDGGGGGWFVAFVTKVNSRGGVLVRVCEYCRELQNCTTAVTFFRWPF